MYSISCDEMFGLHYSGPRAAERLFRKWRGQEGDLLQHQDEEERYATARVAGPLNHVCELRRLAFFVHDPSDIPSAAEIVQRLKRIPIILKQHSLHA